MVAFIWLFTRFYMPDSWAYWLALSVMLVYLFVITYYSWIKKGYPKSWIKHEL